MRNTIWFGLVVSLTVPLATAYAQAPGAQPPAAPGQPAAAVAANLSPGAAEVVRLASSGVGDDVVLAYIQNSQAPFNLTADDVLYLKDQGLSPQVTSAMLNHDSTLRNQPQQYAPAAVAPAAPPPTAPVAPAPPAALPPVTAAPPAAAPAPAYVTSPPADVTYFYNDLSPYGSWVYLDGYGWSWQPRAVVLSAGWRPYCDGGYWVYTDAGWYWQSTYSWGWAPFHYGRWYLHPHCGWVWLPDRVWGPAWVTWRMGGDCCGWAPLPPHADFDMRLGFRFNGVSVGANFDFGLGLNAFAFVSLGDFCAHDLGHRCLPPARVNTVYRQTTIINNYVVNKNTIMNRGIPIERVSSASRTAVPRATVRDLPAGGTRGADRTGSVVYRRPLQAPARPVNMVAQKVDAQHPAIQHAPIAAARVGQPPASSRTASAPASSRPTTQAPKVSPWSSGGRPASSPQSPAVLKTSQPASRVTYAPAASHQPEQRKQGTTVMPGYRSGTGLPASNKAPAAAQSRSTPAQTSAESRNAHVYYPKGYHQAAEIHSLSRSDQPQPGSASTPSKGSESPSRKKD
jgi:hypothetical protein